MPTEAIEDLPMVAESLNDVERFVFYNLISILRK